MADSITSKMKVPYFDLKEQYSQLREEILGALDRVSRNASFILGEEVENFEQEFARHCETKHCPSKTNVVGHDRHSYHDRCLFRYDGPSMAGTSKR